MQAMAMEQDEYVEDFEEQPKAKRRTPTRARTRALPFLFGADLDIQPVKFVCHCWRCRGGGVALSDMRSLDRLLARHLLRMTPYEREAWLRDWALNPSHGQQGVRVLNAWIGIAGGEQWPEPKYFARVWA